MPQSLQIFTPPVYTLADHFFPKLQGTPWNLSLVGNQIKIWEEIDKTTAGILEDYGKKPSVFLNFEGFVDFRDMGENKIKDLLQGNPAPAPDKKIFSLDENWGTTAHFQYGFSTQTRQRTMLTRKVIIKIFNDPKIVVTTDLDWVGTGADFVESLGKGLQF
jgi:hypothetical protein